MYLCKEVPDLPHRALRLLVWLLRHNCENCNKGLAAPMILQIWPLLINEAAQEGSVQVKIHSPVKTMLLFKTD